MHMIKQNNLFWRCQERPQQRLLLKGLSSRHKYISWTCSHQIKFKKLEETRVPLSQGHPNTNSTKKPQGQRCESSKRPCGQVIAYIRKFQGPLLVRALSYIDNYLQECFYLAFQMMKLSPSKIHIDSGSHRYSLVFFQASLNRNIVPRLNDVA